MTTPKPRGRHGRFTKTPATAERAAKAVDLRARGFTYQAIADALGCDLHRAHDAVQQGLAQVPVESVEHIRRIELEKLRLLERKAWQVVESHHLVVITSGQRAGLIVKHPETGEYLEDHGPVLQALDRLLKIAERRAKLLGLDSPVKHSVQVVTEDAVDAAIRNLEQELSELDDRGNGNA